MTKDFAGRARTGTRKSKASKPRKRVSATQRVLFHGPSFACGALVGAAIVVLAAYGPEYLESQSTQEQSSPDSQTAPPPLEFKFDEILKRNEVKPDPEPYAVPESNLGPVILQAASFRVRADAEKLRAQLLLENLPAQTQALRIEGKQWYRVTVGPFDKDSDVQRTLVRLNEMGLAATKSYLGQ